MTKRVTIKAEGRAASAFYAAKLARFQAAQALSKERKRARQYAKQLAYNRPWLRRYRRRLKQEAKESQSAFLRLVRRMVADASAEAKATELANKRATRLAIKQQKLAGAMAVMDKKIELTRLKDAEQRRGWLEAGPIPDDVHRAIIREKLRRKTT
jgi:hypothetical protein